jgi:hypothetical protein
VLVLFALVLVAGFLVGDYLPLQRRAPHVTTRG